MQTNDGRTDRGRPSNPQTWLRLTSIVGETYFGRSLKFHFPCRKHKFPASLIWQFKKRNLRRIFTEAFCYSFPMTRTIVTCISLLAIHEMKWFFLKRFCTKLAAFPFHFSQNQNVIPKQIFPSQSFPHNQRCKTMRHKLAHKFAHNFAHKISHRIRY